MLPWDGQTHYFSDVLHTPIRAAYGDITAWGVEENPNFENPITGAQQNWKSANIGDETEGSVRGADQIIMYDK